MKGMQGQRAALFAFCAPCRKLGVAGKAAGQQVENCCTDVASAVRGDKHYFWKILSFF